MYINPKLIGRLFGIFILILPFSCSGYKRHLPLKDAVINGGFETVNEKLTGWELESSHPDEQNQFIAQGEPSVTVVEEAHSGKNALHVFWDIPDTDSWNSLWMLTNTALYPVSPEDIFTVTAWMKGTSGLRCGKVWMEVIGLSDNKVVKVGIGKDMLNARSYWMQFEAKIVVPEGCNQMQVRFTGGHRTDLFLDDVKVYAGLPASHKRIIKPLVTGFATERIQERLNRGIVALPVDNTEVYIGWRLLSTDTGSVAFNLYRISGNGSPVLLNDKPVINTTDFIDRDPVNNGTSSYFVRTVINGVEGASSENANIILPTEKDSCIYIKLDGDYSAIRAGVGDLDGDEQYEYIIKRPKINFDPWMGDWREGKGFWRPSPETYKLEAYRLDGTLMWHYDMGWSIEVGVWFSPYVIYDLNGDGCAEVALKAGEGDFRQPDGRVWTGPEYLMILDGKTGKEIARTDWIPREGYDTHESLNRNQLCVAYLDGKTPCIIAERGTYDIIALAAYTFDNGQLKELWKWNDREEGGLSYTGQGAHCVHAADVDNDDRDEIVIGSAVIDDNGTGLWSNDTLLNPIGGMYGYNSGSGRGHPDHCVVGELDPTRPGLEMYICYEPGMTKNGICQIDARTGEFLWGLDEETRHGHYGLIADIDPGQPGVELWAGDEELNKFWLFSPQGKVLSNNENTNRLAAFWNDDLQREYLDQKKKRLINYVTNIECGPEFPAVPLVIADVLGDWREEVILAVPGELRIYTTTIPARDRRVSLMSDPIYRLDVCQESQGYLSLPAFKVNPY
jgi:rhamnogalacturonan endolyase